MRIEHGTTEPGRGFVPGIGFGDFVDSMMGHATSTPLRTDRGSSGMLRRVMAEGMADALRRVLDEREGTVAGTAGTVLGGLGEGGGVPHMLHGRAGSSAGLPSIRYGHDAEGHVRHAPYRPGHQEAERQRTPGHIRRQDVVGPGGPMPIGDGNTDPTSLKGVLFRGESAGKPGIYNHRVGGSYPVGGNNADKLTIGELQRRQHAGGIFAAGKYQIVPKTMDGAVKALGLQPDDLFDSATQDRIYTDYLAGSKRPEIGAYVTGKSDDLRGANTAVAEEWASVGDPNEGGRSHYWKTGVNKSSVTTAQAQEALKKARSTYQRLVQEGIDPETARRSALLGIDHPKSVGPHLRPTLPQLVPDVPASQRDAERAVLPRKAPDTAPAQTTEHQAMSGGLDVDHSGVREAIHHVRTLKAELASLGTANVDVKHRGFGDRGDHAPGRVRSALNGNFSSDGRGLS